VVAKKERVQPFFDARGRLLIERRGLPREMGSTLANDAYHFLRTATWTRITILFTALYLGINAAFALLLWIPGGEITGANGFLDYYWFSVETVATVGYGTLAPADTYAHVVVLIESFVGIGFSALATGVFFARFATPSARVIFSNVAIIGECEGKRMLQFRMANARATAIVEAMIHVYLSRDEYLPNGDRMRRIHDLALRRTTSPIFALSWVAQHTIDESSPLFGVTAENLGKSTANIVVTFQGIDDRLAATVHTRWAYNLDDIVFDRRFVDIIKIDKSGTRYLDFTEFHATEPLATAQATSAAGPA
jgi:inward rectifier potassium channel